MTTVVLILIKQELDLDAAFDVVVYMMFLYVFALFCKGQLQYISLN